MASLCVPLASLEPSGGALVCAGSLLDIFCLILEFCVDDYTPLIYLEKRRLSVLYRAICAYEYRDTENRANKYISFFLFKITLLIVVFGIGGPDHATAESQKTAQSARTGGSFDVLSAQGDFYLVGTDGMERGRSHSLLPIQPVLCTT